MACALPLPAGVRRFALPDLAPQRWRNGAGLTRELAAGRSAAAGAPDWDWRVSVAEITAAGAFSVFPGIDRQAALLSGQGLELRAAQRVWQFGRIGALHAFAGDARVTAALHCGPVQLFNLMLVRGRASALLQVHRADARIALCAAASHVLLVAQGVFAIALAHPGADGGGADAQLLLHPGQGLRLCGRAGLLRIAALAAPACLMHAHARAGGAGVV